MNDQLPDPKEIQRRIAAMGASVEQAAEAFRRFGAACRQLEEQHPGLIDAMRARAKPAPPGIFRIRP